MTEKKRGWLMMCTLIAMASLVASCTRTLSQSPAATPTLISTNLFVSPFPSVENPLEMIQQFAKQTSEAQTAIAGGITPGTPQPIVTGTPPTSTNTLAPGTPTNANGAATTAVVAVTVTPGVASTSIPVQPGTRPASYTLQPGEFPYCIARRFDVDPDQLLSMNGLTVGNLYLPGITLKIPQTGAFPGDRALAAHPTTYTVATSDETVFGVACRYGDVDPNTLAANNGISVNADLSVGQTLKIP